MFFSEELSNYLDNNLYNCNDIKRITINLKYLDDLKGILYFIEETVSDVTVKNVALGLSDVEEIDNKEDAINTILNGNAILVIEGKNKALKIISNGFPGMGIGEVKNEQTVRGSSEGFSTSYKKNTLLIRKRIKSNLLKINSTIVGNYSKTSIGILYIEGVARRQVINEVKERISKINIDGFMDSGVIEQITERGQWSPFPQYMTTERPDRASQLLLKGHVIVLIDNSPVALVLPVNFSTFLKAADDYYDRWGIVTLERILRYIAVFFAVSLPAIYISVVNFRPEILPDNLIQIFINARKNIPYPVIVEVLIMEISFELIREAGVRIPGAMGNAIGIVGGLIVGSAAVDASLASPIIVIVVALTALCSFTIPNNEFSQGFRVIKYLLIIMSAIYGIYGYLVGLLFVFIHLSGLKSYGFPYLSPMAAARKDRESEIGDFILRLPYKYLGKKTVFSQEKKRK